VRLELGHVRALRSYVGLHKSQEEREHRILDVDFII